jgi:hypothetical protein
MGILSERSEAGFRTSTICQKQLDFEPIAVTIGRDEHDAVTVRGCANQFGGGGRRMWFNLNRKTGEPGGSDETTSPVWVNSDSIQFLQGQAGGTRIYLRGGALESIDVTELPDEVMEVQGRKLE